MQVQTTYEVTVAVRDGKPEVRFRPWSIDPESGKREIFNIPLDEPRRAGDLLREFATMVVTSQQQSVAELHAALTRRKATAGTASSD